MKLLVILMAVCLAGCKSYPRTVQSIEVAPGAEFELVDPAQSAGFSALQKVTVFWAEHKLSFNVQLENTNGIFHLVGLTPVYSRSFLISFSKGIIDFKEHPYFRYPVNPENMLADFQMAFLETQALKNRKLEIKTYPGKREFWKGEDLIQTIEYSSEDKWQSEVNIINHKKNYRLKIKTLQFENL